MWHAAERWQFDCHHHLHAHECPDALISIFADGQYGIIVHDGGDSHVRIRYCPWCGAELDKDPDRTTPRECRSALDELVEMAHAEPGRDDLKAFAAMAWIEDQHNREPRP